MPKESTEFLPKERKMRKDVLRRLHRELWAWCSENPSKEKKYWPGWASKGNEHLWDKYPQQMRVAFRNKCFACASTYVSPTAHPACNFCPCKWKTFYVNNATCLNRCSQYMRWKFADSTRERQALALEIMDLWPDSRAYKEDYTSTGRTEHDRASDRP